MIQSKQRQKISPVWAVAGNSHPTQDLIEETRAHWKKTFHINGIPKGKTVQKKRRLCNERRTIRRLIGGKPV